MKKEVRPVLQIPRSRLEIITEFIAALGILVHVLILVHYWPILPEIIPTHFGLSGEPDGWGSKSSLFFLLAVNAALYLMLTVLNCFPHIFNYVVQITEKNAREQYYNARLSMSFLKAGMVWIFAYIQWGTVEAALGNASGLGEYFLIISTIVIFIPMLYFIRRSRDIS